MIENVMELYTPGKLFDHRRMKITRKQKYLEAKRRDEWATNEIS